MFFDDPSLSECHTDDFHSAVFPQNASVVLKLRKKKQILKYLKMQWLIFTIISPLSYVLYIIIA